MMLLVYTILIAAFVAGWLKRERIAIALLVVCFAVAAGEFLWEIYSPQSGFAMPWISVERVAAPTPTREG